MVPLLILTAEFFEDTFPLQESLKCKYILLDESVWKICLLEKKLVCGHHFTFSEYAASVSQIAKPATPCSSQNRSA